MIIFDKFKGFSTIFSVKLDKQNIGLDNLKTIIGVVKDNSSAVKDNSSSVEDNFMTKITVTRIA